MAENPEDLEYEIQGIMKEKPFDGEYSTWDLGRQTDIAAEGEIFLLTQGAGGGLGDPLERDPDLPDAFAEAKYRRLRETMETAVGIERTRSGLDRARSALRRLKGEVDAYTRTRVSRSLYELRNAAVCGLLVARAASDAPSAGCHYVVTDADTDPTAAQRGDAC